MNETIALPHALDPLPSVRLGMVVLQADETIETELRGILPADLALPVSRVPSGEELTQESIAEMETNLTRAASLLPRAGKSRGDPEAYTALAYACTSGTAQIGQARVAELMRAGLPAEAVTEPVSALIAACRALSVARLGVLTPYVEEVGSHLRQVLSGAGINLTAYGSFNQVSESRVARICRDSVLEAGRRIAREGPVEALFLSCTNLRSFTLIEELEAELGLPVLSSNQVLGWHLLALAGRDTAAVPGRIGMLRPA